jgi:hypothetical protein
MTSRHLGLQRFGFAVSGIDVDERASPRPGARTRTPVGTSSVIDLRRRSATHVSMR